MVGGRFQDRRDIVNIAPIGDVLDRADVVDIKFETLVSVMLKQNRLANGIDATASGYDVTANA